MKIAHDVKVVETDYKATKLIRIRAEMMGHEITSAQIRGDLFVIPKEAVSTLEKMLVGVRLEDDELMNAIEKFYEVTKAQTPGIDGLDFKDAFMKLREHL